MVYANNMEYIERESEALIVSTRVDRLDKMDKIGRTVDKLIC